MSRKKSSRISLTHRVKSDIDNTVVENPKKNVSPYSKIPNLTKPNKVFQNSPNPTLMTQ